MIKITYQVDDGYVGRTRPQYTSVDPQDFSPDMTDDEISEQLMEFIDEDMRQNIGWSLLNETLEDHVAAIREAMKND